MAVVREPADNLPLVIDYLESNPDVFLENPALLSKLRLPHISGQNVSSLIEVQVDRLRKTELTLKDEIKHLKSIQTEQHALLGKAHELARQLMISESIESLYDALYRFLKHEYQASQLLIYFFVDKRPANDYRELRYKHTHSNIRHLFSGLFNLNRTLCDSLSEEYLDKLFGKESHTINATVSLPVQQNDILALFVLGSREYNVYTQGFEIDILNYLKDVFIQQYLVLH